MKKLLVLMATAFLLTACSATKDGAELYGNVNGGWQDDVDVTSLSATELTKKLKKTGADVVYFSFNDSGLDSEAKATLRTQAEWLKENPRALVVIEGRCDERGTREYNLALGEQRANAARSYLIAQGISADRILTISYGKDKPLPDALGSNEEAWAKNRSATTVAY